MCIYAHTHGFMRVCVCVVAYACTRMYVCVYVCKSVRGCKWIHLVVRTNVPLPVWLLCGEWLASLFWISSWFPKFGSMCGSHCGFKKQCTDVSLQDVSPLRIISEGPICPWGRLGLPDLGLPTLGPSELVPPALWPPVLGFATLGPHSPTVAKQPRSDSDPRAAKP